jgi:hypothetical protein
MQRWAMHKKNSLQDCWPVDAKVSDVVTLLQTTLQAW